MMRTRISWPTSFSISAASRAAAAGGGQEGADADVDGEAAFDYGGDGAGDDGFVGEGPLQGGPVFGLCDFVTGEFW